MPDIYRLNNFVPQELVCPITFKRFGKNSIRYIDPRLISVLNVLRAEIDEPMTVNNWHIGGNFVGSGLRVHGSKHWSQFSAHSFGMAIDARGSEWDTEVVRRAIIDGDIVLPHPVRVELDVSWLHIDVMNNTDSPVITFGV